VIEGSFTLQRYENGFTPIPATIDAAANTATTTGGISQFSDWTLLAPLAPTATPVSISGRVVLPADIRATRAMVTLTDDAGVSQTVLTGKGGRFRFDGVPAGRVYVISVRVKGYVYAAQIVNAAADTDDLIFTAVPSL